jgi:2-hydroxy-3-keto-5-methylthiopentenyl-1-phosphate phosphatase
VLVRAYAGAGLWEDLERKLAAGAMTLREVLATQAAHVRASLDEADRLLSKATRIDPSFSAFVECCEERGYELVVVSSGVQPLIERAFARAGLERVRILANGIDASRSGWQFLFRDDSQNGHDKAAAVRAARDSGKHTAYIGDGPSDFEAALAAHDRYAKAGRGLERYLAEQAIPFVSFRHFNEIAAQICR